MFIVADFTAVPELTFISVVALSALFVLAAPALVLADDVFEDEPLLVIFGLLLLPLSPATTPLPVQLEAAISANK